MPIAVSAAGAGLRAVTGWDMQGPQTATLPMPTDWEQVLFLLGRRVCSHD